MELRELTKAEEEIMRVLWTLKKAFVKDVLTKLPEPKPAYTTVSTIIRILERKGLVHYTAFGKTHEYFPLISEAQYRKFQTEQLITNYFDNSVKNLVSFFVDEKNISVAETNEIIELLNKPQQP